MDPDPPSASAPPVGAALREAKRSVREQALAARDAMPPQARAAASAAISATIVAQETFRSARTILVTLPFRTEWDSRLVIARALADGKVVVSPRVDAVARMLSLHRIGDVARDVAPGYRDIPEPLPHCPVAAPADIEWVLVPGVAFDPAGRRLGYGGGYYDRLLPMLSPGAPRVAGAFEAQLVASVPAGPHDLTVDVVVTESRIVRPDGASSR
jgi:5-formyltetrahydrofolate cyclo-ligase